MFLQTAEISSAQPAYEPVFPAAENERVAQPWRPGLFNNETGLINRGAWGKFREAFAKLHGDNAYAVLMDRIEQATPATGYGSPRFLAEAAIWHFTRLSPDAQKRLVDEWCGAGMKRIDAEQAVRDTFNVPLVWDDFDFAGRVEIRFDGAGNVAAIAISRQLERTDSACWSFDLAKCLRAMREKIDTDPALDRSDSLFGRIDI